MVSALCVVLYAGALVVLYAGALSVVLYAGALHLASTCCILQVLLLLQRRLMVCVACKTTQC
jgi:hypothetical protein